MDSVLKTLDVRFADTHRRSCEILERIPPSDLYRKPAELADSMLMFSCGEFVLRSAAAVEQTCGGLMTRLWDDPFEWTLPERLSTPVLVIEYLNEVEATRRKAFGFLSSDEQLLKQLPAPDRLRTILDLLLDTLARAEHFQGRAFALFRLFSDPESPRE